VWGIFRGERGLRYLPHLAAQPARPAQEEPQTNDAKGGTMMENTFEVFEDNGGCITLAVLHDGQPIFVGGGYYGRRPADLMDDIAARDDVDEWDAGVYPDAMGAAGKLAFGVDD
jgi:hypothetical protein